MEEGVELSMEADDFYRTLPGDQYPQALVDQYPRIANTIVELRYDRAKLKEYFTTLLNDSRGGRQGFPFAVLKDLQNVHDLLVGDDTGGSPFWV